MYCIMFDSRICIFAGRYVVLNSAFPYPKYRVQQSVCFDAPTCWWFFSSSSLVANFQKSKHHHMVPADGLLSWLTSKRPNNIRDIIQTLQILNASGPRLPSFFGTSGPLLSWTLEVSSFYIAKIWFLFIYVNG